MIEELRQKYDTKKKDIEKRMQDFCDAFSLPDEDIFAELCFCLLTPQSKAKSCWRAVEKLKETGLLYSGSSDEIKKWLAAVRFNENKSKYIIEVRKLFVDDYGKLQIKNKLNALGSPVAMRLWLVKNVKGYGLKEASHFLRNVGFGDDIAILDRHILKNLVRYGVIDEVPKSLTDKKYFEIEEKMRAFAQSAGIPFSHLDLLWWSEEAGEIFK
ncbi:MAG: N-glycosylase/DNA lyase [Candidatus Aenigmarchaeota archaeon]|nr:N-glycosylase/DNA lyase [Candidatus Aenigmarchaeota archaeon]